ncbi:unnamed protein product [Phaedon cochleariae]|uniref:Aspartyl/asparaginy/proline hydroxylase domain-containing protein n=1 Tax=Phaedon cochleariae TaxID=80249 RepID=A0A9P0DHB4_PHACE|nr:unnamed protein product [Phaedon cochleariae]
MSGDVQPRKRKDKKRRKDDFDPVPVQVHPPIFANNSLSDDVNIHVHKEGGTGGNICAKLVFFFLFSALVVLIGLIITEHRGLTDLDSADTESRFSHIFEGLVDSGRDAHDHEDPGIEEALDTHDDHEENEEELNVSEPEDEEETLSEENDKSEGDDHSEENSMEEEDIQADELEEEDDSAVSEEQEEDDQEGEDIPNDEEDDDVQAEDEEILEDDDEEIADTVEESDENYQGGVNSEEVDEDKNEEGSKGSDEAEGDGSEEQEDDDGGEYNKDESEENDSQASENDNDEAEDNDNEAHENGEDGSDEEDNVKLIKRKRDINVENDDEEPAAFSETREEHEVNHLSGEKVVGEIVEKTEAEAEREQSEQDEHIQESSGLAVKLSVGVAILVVAYLVLVRKWRNADDSKPSLSNEQMETVPDLSRRNTIVPPPSYQEIEPDLENAEEDYSEEELSEEDEPVEAKSLKAKYQELRATYSRSLTPESDPDREKSPKPHEYEDEENVDEEEEEISEEEDDDDYENEEEYDEDDDEELLTRLEAKYGKLLGVGGNLVDKRNDSPQDMVEDSDSDRQSDDEEYKNMNITNKNDFQIRNELDEAQKSVRHNPSSAVKLFDAILRKNPSSPRSLYGKAISLDALADEKQSNVILEKALAIYIELLQREDVLPVLYKMVADRCINRTRFMGQYKKLVMVHQLVIKRFPGDPKHKNDLAVTYLTINRIEDARSVFKDVLKRWPSDGYALVHYGFILKTADNKLEEAVHYFRKGLKTRDEGVIDGRFYFHLGDALTRLGRTDEANKVYEEGAENKVFLSKHQRSLYNVPRLTGRPWWPKEHLQNVQSLNLLEQHWKEISQEALAVLNEEGLFRDEAENLKDTGDWKQLELFARGRRNAKNCRKCPITCAIVDRIPEARSCRRGQTKFSVMHPGTHVWPHCGPTNCRLRAHLGLRVPPGTFIRVADRTRSWKEGALIVFDDSFEHEVWHNGTGIRLVLIVDIWHPELTPYEKKSLSAI